MDGLRDLLRVGSAEHEHHMRRRLLQRLEERVERLDREHVNLVDDVDLVASTRRSVVHATDDLLADVIHAGSARRVQLVYVGMLPVSDEPTVLARAIRVGRGALLADERLGKETRSGGLARTARPREQVGMAHLVRRDGVLERALDMLLPHHILEHLRAIFPVQRFCHELRPSPS